MPFKVQYDAPAAVIGGYAQAGGLGDFQRWQAEMQMRQAQMQQQDLQQRRALAANEAAQMRGMASDAQDRQMRFGLAQQELGQREQMREWEVEDRDFAAGLREHEGVAEDIRAGVRRITPGMKAKLAELDAAVTDLRDGTHTPESIAVELPKIEAQRRAIMGTAPYVLPGEETPDPNEIAKSNSFFHEWPDGSTTKGFIETRNGAPTFREIQDDSQKQAEAQQKMQIAQQAAQQKVQQQQEAARIKAQADALKYRDEQNKRVLDYYTELMTEQIPETNPDGTVAMTGDVNSVEGQKPKMRVRRPEEVQQAMALFKQGLSEAEMPMPNLIQMQQPQAMPSDQINQLVYGMAGGMGTPSNPLSMPQQPAPPQAPPPQVAGPDPYAPAPNHGYLPEQAAPQGDPQLTAMAEQALPQVTSDAEFDALPSGTHFLAPDGTIRKKP